MAGEERVSQGLSRILGVVWALAGLCRLLGLWEFRFRGF